MEFGQFLHAPNRSPRTATTVAGTAATPTATPTTAATATPTATASAAFVAFLAFLAILALSPAPLAAQEQTTDTDFDLDRAWISEPGQVDPFLVEQVKPLAAALDARELEKSTWLLVVEHPAGRLALVTDQLSYHHVAQGSIRGEPWMVSF